MIRLILCADDYGLAPGVSRGIRRLLAAGRLSATSCMTVSPHWTAEAAAVQPFADRVDVGLHLTLTDQSPLGQMPSLAPAGRLPSVRELLLRCLTGRVDAAEIRSELERQIAAFESALGRPPAFLDGHQHVHQLPVVRAAVFDLWRERLKASGAWLRLCDEPVSAILSRGVSIGKSLLIAGLGHGLRRQAAAAGVPTNDRFAGVHDFSRRRPYGELFERFIAPATSADGARLVVMCHPGEADDELRARDPVTDAREDELRYFESPSFPEILRRYRIELGRFT